MATMPTHESVQELQTKFRQAQQNKNAYTPDWFLNVAFFSGFQWVRWAAQRLTPVNMGNREFRVDNRILPVVTSRSARKVKNKPVFVCTPFTADDSDVEAARVGERVVEADWTNLNLQSKLFDAVLWSDVCSDGFWKVYWDSTLGESQDFLFSPDGKPIMNPQDGTPLRADEGNLLPPEVQANTTVKSVAAGDVNVEVISPFEFFPDPLAKSMDTLEWCFEEKIRSMEYVKKRYPKSVDGRDFTPTPDADVPTGLSLGTLTPDNLYGKDPQTYEGVKVYEYWAKPCSMYPNGWHVIYANDTMLVEEEPFDANPYVHFTSVQVPGQFFSRGVTSQLRDPQTELNMIRTQISENAKRFGNPSLLMSRQAQVEYSGVPGEIIEYDSTVSDAVPSFLQPPSLPPYVENEIERIEKSIEEISGMHEVSRATVPAGVTAASAINLLQEADDTRLGPEIQALERALGHAGTKILKLRATFNTDERTFRIAGEDGNWDIAAFRGAMLGQDPKVEVQAGSAMPRSKAAKQAAMTEMLALMFQYQVPIEQRDLRKFLKDYEVGGLERVFEGLSEDERQINREHRMLINGEEVPINDFDDDAVHIAGHTDFQKSARYAALNPDQQACFVMHVADHRERQQGIVNAQLQAQAADAQAAQQQQLSMGLDQTQADAEAQIAIDKQKEQSAPPS